MDAGERFPTAFRRSAATTEESTPPDSASSTFPPPICSRSAESCRVMKASARAGRCNPFHRLGTSVVVHKHLLTLFAGISQHAVLSKFLTTILDVPEIFPRLRRGNIQVDASSKVLNLYIHPPEAGEYTKTFDPFIGKI